MEIKSETKSLPRNRKCGNCRYFEPAPLWRKGWCRNPRLYDRRANHLVDATTIDCEQVFRARIYWEPMTLNETDAQRVVPARSAGFSADSGGRSPKVPADNALRPTGGKPVIVRREVAPDARFIKKQSRFRRWLLENIPYYDKIDGPIHSVNYRIIIPWLLVVLLLGFILLNLTSSKTPKNPTATPTDGTAIVAGSQTEPTRLVTSGASVSVVTTVLVVANSKTPLPTPTLSNAIATAAVPIPTPTTLAVAPAKVVSPKGLHMRLTPCTDDKNPQCKVLATIPDGTIVQIIGPFALQEGIQWLPITYNNQNGYVAQDFLQRISP